MTYTTIETELTQGVALVWLNRPALRNAMNDVLIDETADAVQRAIDDEAVRAIVLAGRGSAFCAGADLAWMASGRTMSPEASLEDSLRLARLLRLLHDSPKPTVARVQGPAFAGGMGLVAACDVSVASTEARFCLSEVKLGLIPAMISPYVIRAMGAQQARRWFVTGEVFDAAEAWRIGFVHELVQPDGLDEAVNGIVGHLLAGGPKALGECKRLVQDMAGRPIDDTIGRETASRIARVRATDEAQEGIAAFFDKRRPAWAQLPPTP
ncbi:MAG: enoyl-CoA hydratase/isomerase family protein [Gammaproteobacteria bacterium]